MGGDKTWIYLMDDKDAIIKQLYIGKMRYWQSKFSLAKYKYQDDSRTMYYDGKYYHLTRQACNRERYGVLHFTTIDEMRVILKDSPINEEEKKAYEDMESCVEFIDENIDSINGNNYTIVIYTDHAF